MDKNLKFKYLKRLCYPYLIDNEANVFLDQYLSGSGNELKAKFWSTKSSSRLAFELYSWIVKSEKCIDFQFEYKLPGIKSGNQESNPNMDVYIKTENNIWFIESKYTELSNNSQCQKDLPQAYYVEEADYLSGSGSKVHKDIKKRFSNRIQMIKPFVEFCKDMINLSATEKERNWFDAKQEICHLCGVIMYILDNRNKLHGQHVHLFNVAFNPKGNYPLYETEFVSKFIDKARVMVAQILNDCGINDICFEYDVDTVQSVLAQYGTREAFCNEGKTVAETIADNFKGIDLSL